MHTADVQVDLVAIFSFYMDGERIVITHEAVEVGRHKVAVDVCDHVLESEISDLEPLVIEKTFPLSLKGNAAVFEDVSAIRCA